MAKNNNIRKYSRFSPNRFNIGFIVFFIILVYVLVNIYSYMVSDTIMEYEVQQGRIATTDVYKGIVLRDETVYYATKSGTVNYYVTASSKVSSGDIVYSIDTSGEIAEQISSAAQDVNSLSAEAKEEIAESLQDFSASYQSVNFSEVYSFKESLNSEITQSLSTMALNNLNEVIENASDSFYKISTGNPGIVLYYTDGYEGTAVTDLVSEDFSGSSYKKTNYSSGRTVTEGDAVFKLVTSENWSVVIAISEELAEDLEETTSLQVTFCKDSYTTTASTTIMKIDGEEYLQLSFTSAMIRYANERYLELELMLNNEEGLKIPNSSITTKEFFTVPIEYFMEGDDSDSLGLLVQHTDKDGNTYMEFVTPTVYYSTETAYYIDSEDVSEGDVILKSDSSSQYVIGTDKDSLLGVYNINKGYAVFKQINILYQNEEYAIVETKTSYGISLYDHIALDGSKVSENDFVK